VTGDPADISHACESIVGMDIENVFHGQGRAEKVSAGGMHDAFWFASGSGSLQTNDDERRSLWGISFDVRRG
jgi:hypothetical protein